MSEPTKEWLEQYAHRWTAESLLEELEDCDPNAEIILQTADGSRYRLSGWTGGGEGKPLVLIAGPNKEEVA